jgi:hypothetical protein
MKWGADKEKARLAGWACRADKNPGRNYYTEN